MVASQADTLVRRIFEKAFNQGNFTVVEELLAPDSITHITAWGLPNNRMGLKQWIASFRLAFPDLRCVVEDEILAGDRVAAHWTMRGTHNGLFFGNQPTGRLVEARGILFARFQAGRIIEAWFLIDQYGILQQLGIVPPTRKTKEE